MTRFGKRTTLGFIEMDIWSVEVEQLEMFCSYLQVVLKLKPGNGVITFTLHI